ncbi:hypothetical protein ABF72_12650 [Enterobacter hormaechei subsp. steigerwaltii]|nr:hypothetical protein ABF72_12650 [Enterobacter hormaechei subsp. steigerwaltii]
MAGKKLINVAFSEGCFLNVVFRMVGPQTPKPENQSYRASGLTLLTATISLWNTVYMERAVDALKRKGVKINEQLLSHLSPLGWEHINLTGDYIWKNNRIPASGKFRRLRPAKVERSKNDLNVQ